jgi:hypothetical protein
LLSEDRHEQKTTTEAKKESAMANRNALFLLWVRIPKHADQRSEVMSITIPK